MGKKLSLLERLDNALSVATCNDERNEIYLLLYRTGERVLNHEQEEFYEQAVNYRSLIPAEEFTTHGNGDNVLAGKELAKELKEKIILPERGARGFGAKYKKVRIREFQILKEFFEKRDGRENI